MCGFVGDIIGGVVDVIGSVAEFVIDNALPIISTIAMNYIAPGFGSYLSTTFSLSKEVGFMVAKGIGSAAVSAINGGSLANIVTAGLTPFIPSIGKELGINLDPSGFINKSIADVLGNNVISNIIASAAGNATMAGVTALVTGGDVLEAAGMAGLSGAVSSALAQTWDAVKEYAPKLTQTETQIQDKVARIQDSQSFIDQVQSLQQDMESNYNKVLEYQNNYDEYTKLVDQYNAGDRSVVGRANELASYLNDPERGLTINEIVIPALETQQAYLDSLITNNKSLIDDYVSDVTELGGLQKQYETFTNRVQADYSNFQMADALAKGDYTSATKYYNDLNTYNQAILKVEPNTTVTTPSLTTQQNTFLQEFASATDQAVKDQLASQASQLFADYKAPITTDTTVPTTPTTPTETTTPSTGTETTTGTGTTTGTSTNPYDNLPKLPEEGIGQPTPPSPTTPTTPPTGTTTGSTASNIGNYLTNVGSNVLGNVTKGVIGNEVINAILGNDPQRPSLPTKPRPPSKVDVSTLRPFSGNLPSNVTAGVTPVKKDPTTLTPLTGGLPTTGGTTPTTPTTPTTNTTTQTPTGGLQSNQTQTPPTKVDVSKLTPVTDTNWLKSLGIA